MKKIQLGGRNKSKIKGYALVDDSDYEWLNQWNWHYGKGNVRRYKQGIKKKILMHRIILNAKNGEICDHINGNYLDNQKNNLRICSTQQNQFNKKKNRNNTSGFKGVSWHKKDKVWRSFIGLNKKYIHLGNFKGKINAAYAYDAAAKKIYGKFAKCNF